MKNIKIEITGISPLLQHRFPMPENGEAKKPIRKNKEQQTDDVEKSLYRLPDGTIIQPALHIITSMKKGAAKFQVPGSGKLTFKNIVGGGAVIITPESIPHKIQTYEIDRRPVVVPSTKGRVVRERPVFNNWRLCFEVEFDESEISASDIHEILAYAGRRVGIGDFRPERGGSFGRFVISEFKER